MVSLHDVLAYICQYYPRGQELTAVRLAEISYLADLLFALEYNSPLVDNSWEFNIYYGLNTTPVAEIVADDVNFDIIHALDVFGYPKEIIRLREPVTDFSLDPRAVQVLKKVIEFSSSSSFDDFVQYLYRTFAIVARAGASKLNLVELAQRYRRELGQVPESRDQYSAPKMHFTFARSL